MAKKRRRLKRRISKPRAYKLTKSRGIDQRSVGQGTALSPKHRQVIANYTDPHSPTQGNATKSALAAGNSPRSASNRGSHKNKRDEGQRELTRIYEATGITIEKLAKGMKRALNAKEMKVFLCQKDGELVYSKAMIAHDVRLRAIRLAHELRGDFAPKEINMNVLLLAGRIQAARRRESERTPPPVVVGPDDKEPEPVTPKE